MTRAVSRRLPPSASASKSKAKPRAAKSSAAKSSTIKSSAAKPSTAKRQARDEQPYHHGDLHQALLVAAERILERDGLNGLTLRAVAREAGVSHAAPSHHFGDLTGLVSELAAIGFRQFDAAMNEAALRGTTLMEKGLARAKAYVGYARGHPGMYLLMFRTERLDMKRPALHEAANASFAALADAIGARRHEAIAEDALSLEQAAEIARAWSTVHGFTMLLLDGRLTDLLRRSPAGTDEEKLLDEMLRGFARRAAEAGN